MSDDARTDTAEHTPTTTASGPGRRPPAAAAGAGGAYAATRALHEERTDDTADAVDDAADADDTTTRLATRRRDRRPRDADRDTVTAARRRADAADARLGRGPVGAVRRPLPRRGVAARRVGRPAQDEPAEMTIVDPEAYAATEPLMASDRAPPVQPEPRGDTDGEPPASRRRHASDDRRPTSDDDRARRRPTRDGRRAERRARGTDTSTDEHAPAEAGAAVAETDDTDRSAADVAEEPHRGALRPDPDPRLGRRRG